MTEDEKRLHIYKASAGAGKTHTMTEAFLRHILREPKSSYREVQAVTFTNLATGELKQRFFKELSTLAESPQASPFHESFNDLFTNDQTLSRSARSALKEILFDYGGLRVKTIDSFFQDIIHALAIELKQRPTTRIELSTDQILGLAVERLFEDPSDVATVAIGRFLENREDKSMYSLRSGLTQFAKQLYNEQIQELEFQGVKPFDETHYQSFVESVEKRIEALREDICKLVERFRTLSSGLQAADFPGKSHSPLARLMDETKREPTIGDSGSESFLTETTWKKFRERGDVEDTLSERYKKGLEDDDPKIITFYSIIRTYADINTLQVSIKKGYELQLLGEIQNNVGSVVTELGVKLLDDAKRLIRHLVGQEGSTAFIYERLGTTLRHHMIDEFQDTSRFQYENFRPLLVEALGAGGDSFIVGDVKQSIYRFRNSDPMLLQKDLAEDFSDVQRIQNLENNWRSAPAIVSFNNRFFSLLPNSPELKVDSSILDESLIREVYSPEGVHQNIPTPHRKMAGAVFIHHCTEFKEVPEPTLISQDKLQSKIDYLIDYVIPSIQKRGYKQSDIAILAPKNDTLQRVAETIIEHNKVNQHNPLAFVSREMLTLDANPLYRLIIDILHSVLLNAGLTEDLYMRSFEHRLVVAHLEELSRSVITEGESSPTFDFARCYQEGQTASLYELLLLIVDLLDPLITSADQPYIDAFLDTVQDYSQDNYVDLQGFLEWLESHTPRLSLETQDALQLLTIHSAKGLGLPVVCLLEYQMRLLDSNDTIWCKGHEIAPLQELLGESVPIPPVLPISPTNDAKVTPFRTRIVEAESSALLDRINALYVAMTRAKSEMHLILDEEKETMGKRLNFETLISQLVAQISETASSEGIIADIKEIPLRTADTSISTTSLEVTLQTFLTEDYPLTAPQVQDIEGSTPSAPLDHIPRVRQYGKPADLSVRRSQSVAYQERDAVRNGLFLHALLSEIDYLDSSTQLRKFLKTKSLQGLLPIEQLDSLVSLLEQALTDPDIAEYYQRDSGWQVLNERSIVQTSIDRRSMEQRSRILRPDRIMYDMEGERAVIIDYKSGSEAQEYIDRHRRQLHAYRQTLLKSGFRSVRAYLLYLSAEGHQVVDLS